MSHPITFPSFTPVNHVSMVLNILFHYVCLVNAYTSAMLDYSYLSAYIVVSPDIKQIAVSHSAVSTHNMSKILRFTA